jgi:hypothetical protein
MAEQTFQSVDQILSEIKRRQISYASSIWVPSLNKDVRFLEISTGQQKRLVKSIVDSPVEDKEFTCTFRDILKENCVEENVNIDSFNIIDKLFIAINLRSSSIGPVIPMETKTKAGDKITVDIDLTDVLNHAKTNFKSVQPLTISNDVFSIVCNVPTIGIEWWIARNLRTEETNIEDEKAIKEFIGEAFIEEIMKYIEDVKLKDKDALVDINWKSLSWQDRVKIVGTLGSKLLRQIIEYINEVKEAANNVQLINFKFKDEVFTERLALDENFFMVS